MLAVAVEDDQMLSTGSAEPLLDGGAETLVVGLADDACARRAGTVRGLVGGAIVDHENFVPGGDCPDAGDHVADGILFVEGRKMTVVVDGSATPAPVLGMGSRQKSCGCHAVHCYR